VSENTHTFPGESPGKKKPLSGVPGDFRRPLQRKKGANNLLGNKKKSIKREKICHQGEVNGASVEED